MNEELVCSLAKLLTISQRADLLNGQKDRSLTQRLNLEWYQKLEFSTVGRNGTSIKDSQTNRAKASKT
jgi:hypothetical protein